MCNHKESQCKDPGFNVVLLERRMSPWMLRCHGNMGFLMREEEGMLSV
jgi:hypothetical protein